MSSLLQVSPQHKRQPYSICSVCYPFIMTMRLHCTVWYPSTFTLQKRGGLVFLALFFLFGDVGSTQKVHAVTENITMRCVGETEVCVMRLSLELQWEAVKCDLPLSRQLTPRGCCKFNLSQWIYSWFGQYPGLPESSAFIGALHSFLSALKCNAAGSKQSHCGTFGHEVIDRV